jgi:hypothetical protein
VEDQTINNLPEEVKPMVVSAFKQKMEEHYKAALDLSKFIGGLGVAQEIFNEALSGYVSGNDLLEDLLISEAKGKIGSGLEVPSGDEGAIEEGLGGLKNGGVNLITQKPLAGSVQKKPTPTPIKKPGRKRGPKPKVKSRYKGVSWDKPSSKWRCRILFKGRHLELGKFSDEVEAAKAYDKMKLKATNGDISKLNFPGNIQ